MVSLDLDLPNLDARFPDADLWRDARFIPLYASGASVVLLLCTALAYLPAVRTILSRYISYPRKEETLALGEEDTRPLRGKLQFHIESCGGAAVYSFHVIRFLGCIGLVALSTAAVILTGQIKDNTSASQVSRLNGETWEEVGFGTANIYAAILALGGLTLGPISRRVCNAHAALILAVLFGVFAWRNLVPLAYVTGLPADRAIPWLMWSRGVLLSIAGVLVPLLTPRIYYPVDPMNAAPVPAPEQTASILSFILYAYLDGLIVTAYQVGHVPYEQLPPLADYDWAQNLSARSMPRLEPLDRRRRGLKDRHLFFGLMDVFGWDYFRLGIIMIFYALAGFLAPVGINRLLEYLETGGDKAIIRPWVWIMFLLLSPVASAILLHLYIFIASRTRQQFESILLQLIFRHSLKIRLTDGSGTERSVTSSAALSAAETEVSHSSNAPPESDVGAEEGATADRTKAQTNGSSALDTAGKQQRPSSQLLRAAPGSATHKDTKHTPRKQGSHTAARINNLIGTDMGNVSSGRDFLSLFTEMPLKVALCVWFLYAVLSWAALVGLAVMILCLPLPGKATQLVNKVQKERMKKTDARVQTITDVMNTIRMVKMFGWEAKVKEELSESRDVELRYVWKQKVLRLVASTLIFIFPLLSMIITFMFYTLIMKRALNASTLFSSIPVFKTLQSELRAILGVITDAIQAKVSLDRIGDFLFNSELIDKYGPGASDLNRCSSEASTTAPNHETIGFHEATFTWMDAAPAAGKQRSFRLHLDHVIFQQDAINLIVGPTGSGKTSTLMALLGEMHFEPSSSDAWFSLPRSHGVSYAAQDPWLQNDTIKENILFGGPMDELRYRKVVNQCALDADLSLFDAGDETEVGEKGLTLSGGQKARISMARAIYSQARIVLLDDIFSALDVHTSRWIVDKCLRGDLVRGRTIILATHNVSLLAPIAAMIITLGMNGRVASQGNIEQGVLTDPVLRTLMRESPNVRGTSPKAEVEGLGSAEQKPGGKLIVVEEMADGRVEWSALKLLLNACGGPFLWLLLVAGYLLIQFGEIIAVWWLGVWASAYESSLPDNVDVSYYLTIYGLIMAGYIFARSSNYILYTFATIKASRAIYIQLYTSVVSSTLRWLDCTPVGRIISRFTQDIRELDGPLTGLLEHVIELTVSLLFKFGAVVLISPAFILPGAIIALLGGFLGQVYVAAQLSVKREMSNSRSPLYNHFGAAMNGLISIRAYGVEHAFESELFKRLDHYSRPSRTFWNINRWLSVRADTLGGLFAAGLGAYIVYFGGRVGASSTGFSLAMAVGFSDLIMYWVRRVNDLEVSSNSLERIQDYLTIEHEPAPTAQGKPPAYWPATGSIRVENLCARYSVDGPLVLSNLSFEIRSGERIGIVGRTGSGKTSLTLALLRMIPCTGTVLFDGLPTHEVNLDVLRSNLTIIPQDPTLISGTLRSNLDPFAQYDDAALNNALRAAGLFRVQSEQTKNAITLDSAVSSGGSNYSVGQRQIIALARAIVRGTKVLILDEATASVDTDTDTVVQASIRSELAHVTLITVAHRLQTIADYDKIMVLAEGKLVEYDKPITLLEKKDSMYRALVDQSGDSESLWNLAKDGRAGQSIARA